MKIDILYALTKPFTNLIVQFDDRVFDARGFRNGSPFADWIRAEATVLARLAAEAHRLRGTAGTFGFARLAALAGKLDEAELQQLNANLLPSPAAAPAPAPR